MDPTLRLAGVNESDALAREQQQAHDDRQHDDDRVTVTLYVTVHAEDGRSHVVPLSFSSADNVPKARPISSRKLLSGAKKQENVIICHISVLIVAMKVACALVCHGFSEQTRGRHRNTNRIGILSKWREGTRRHGLVWIITITH